MGYKRSDCNTYTHYIIPSHKIYLWNQLKTTWSVPISKYLHSTHPHFLVLESHLVSYFDVYKCVTITMMFNLSEKNTAYDQCLGFSLMLIIAGLIVLAHSWGALRQFWPWANHHRSMISANTGFLGAVVALGCLFEYLSYAYAGWWTIVFHCC